MQELELAAKIRTLASLIDVVTAMRSLAAVRLRQAQEHFAGLARYAEATRAALAQGLALLGTAPNAPAAGAVGAPRLLIACFSEHGFVGTLNERLLEKLRATSRPAGEELALYVLGSRGLRLCDERGTEVARRDSMPTTLAGLSATAHRVTEEVFAAIAEGSYGAVELLFMRHQEGAVQGVTRLPLFPPPVEAVPSGDRWKPPLHTLPAPALLIRLIEEFCFGQIIWALAEAFAAEHGARFQTMEAARRNMEQMLHELGQQERALRQEVITNEILEVAAGADLAYLAATEGGR